MTEDSGRVATEDSGRVALRIVRGEPTPEELAAVLAVVSAGGSAGAESGDAASSSGAASLVRGRWNDPALAVRRSLSFGAGGWRASET